MILTAKTRVEEYRIVLDPFELPKLSIFLTKAIDTMDHSTVTQEQVTLAITIRDRLKREIQKDNTEVTL